MAPDAADEVLGRFNVSRESRARLNIYVSVLLYWQKRINLIGPSTIDRLWTRHIADALRLIALLPPATRTLADLGSGAGVPGLVLAIATGHHVHLYESNGKKAAFLREAARQTSAAATVHQIRIELLASDPARPKVEVVLARAFAPLGRLLSCAAPFLADGAVGLFHKGQDIDAELTDATKCWRLRYIKHSGVIDSNGVILEVKEAMRVQP
jgi:16S rRNA (guanine527-N7)-methyltransferase